MRHGQSLSRSGDDHYQNPIASPHFMVRPLQAGGEYDGMAGDWSGGAGFAMICI